MNLSRTHIVLILLAWVVSLAVSAVAATILAGLPFGNVPAILLSVLAAILIATAIEPILFVYLNIPYSSVGKRLVLWIFITGTSATFLMAFGMRLIRVGVQGQGAIELQAGGESYPNIAILFWLITVGAIFLIFRQMKSGFD